jgi:multidrug efflux pump
MGDVVGRLFREFAVTLSITILISAVVSLTLVPMMSGRWLKAHGQDPKQQRGLNAKLDRGWHKVHNAYDRGLTWVLEHQPLTLWIALGTLVLTVLLYVFIPKGLFPVQDTGQLQGRVEASLDVSYGRMAALQGDVVRALLQDPAVDNVASFVGVDAQNNTMLHTGRLLIQLKRPHDGKQEDIMERLQKRAANVAGATLTLQPTQDLTIDAEAGPTPYRVSIEGADDRTVRDWAIRLSNAMQADHRLRSVVSDAAAQSQAV